MSGLVPLPPEDPRPEDPPKGPPARGSCPQFVPYSDDDDDGDNDDDEEEEFFDASESLPPPQQVWVLLSTSNWLFITKIVFFLIANFVIC